MSVRQYLLDLAERVGFTFIFYAVSGGVVFGAVVTVHWSIALHIGLYAAVASALTSLIQWIPGLRVTNKAVDAALRALLTFAQGLAATVTAANLDSATTFRWGPACAVCALATLGSILKSLPALSNPATVGASALVKMPVRTGP